ncbi:hypothetical protein BaRGS_00012453, partial [Batillaria attramentaria]
MCSQPEPVKTYHRLQTESECLLSAGTQCRNAGRANRQTLHSNLRISLASLSPLPSISAGGDT